jgi:hypothetical protein
MSEWAHRSFQKIKRLLKCDPDLALNHAQFKIWTALHKPPRAMPRKAQAEHSPRAEIQLGGGVARHSDPIPGWQQLLLLQITVWGLQ